MPSASRAADSAFRMRPPLARAAALAACTVLIGVGAAGCETTQEKAAKQQARSAHILAARAERQKAKKGRDKPKHHHQEAKSK